MKEIRLHAMRFHTLVGILPHERELAQPIEVDLEVRVGDGDGVIDYRALYAIAAGVISAGPINYLEDIGERIATSLLAYSGRIRSARIAVRKPNVALPGPLAYAEVIVERNADG